MKHTKRGGETQRKFEMILTFEVSVKAYELELDDNDGVKETFVSEGKSVELHKDKIVRTFDGVQHDYWIENQKWEMPVRVNASRIEVITRAMAAQK